METEGQDPPDEPIEDFHRKGAPLDSQGKLERWRSVLALTLARANGCRIYYQTSYVGRRLTHIAIVGRATDAETVRYLYAYLTKEIERLCDQNGRGCGQIWRNNYRLGAIDTIWRRLKEQREQFQTESRQQAQTQTTGNALALVRVDKALARLAAKGTEVDDWLKTNMKLRSRGAYEGSSDNNARAAGRRAGETIALTGKGALGSGEQKRLAR